MLEVVLPLQIFELRFRYSNQVEGEDDGYLRQVILDSVDRLNAMTPAKPNCQYSTNSTIPISALAMGLTTPRCCLDVSFQFSRVGNSPDALKLLKDLDDDTTLYPYIDCQSGMWN